MKYEDWKKEKDLKKVCDSLLDNADMDYSINNCPLSIDMTFYVVGSNIKVIFKCNEIASLNIQKEHDDVPIHLVLEVNVTKKIDPDAGELFCIQVMPEMNIDVACKDFSWHLEEFTEIEQKRIYNIA